MGLPNAIETGCGVRRLRSRLGLAWFVTLLLLAHPAVADPTVTPVGDGTAVAVWSLDTPADYAADNATVLGGNATLDSIDLLWRDTTAAEFALGSGTNVNLTEAPGEVVLETEAVQLLANPGIDVDANWTSAVVDPDGVSGGSGYSSSGGVGGSPSWFVIMRDLTNVTGFQVWYWLNQTVSLTFSPRAATLSGWRLLSFDGAAAPGAVARIVLRTPGGSDAVVSDTGWTNQSDAVFTEMTGNVTSLLAVPGPYEVSLFAHMDTTASAQDIVNATVNWDDVTFDSTRHTTAGTLTSRVFDAGSVVDWEWVSWDEVEPAGTNASLQVRSGNSPVPDASWSPWSTLFADPSINTFLGPNATYAQYRLQLDTANTSLSPSVSEVRVGYRRFRAAGSLETADLVPGQVRRWGTFSSNASIPPETDVSFLYSTDGGLAWFPLPSGGDLSGVSPVSGRIRFRAELTTANTTVSPVLEAFRLTYVSQDPVLQLEVASPASTDAGGSMDYAVFYNNTGGGVAPRAWINVTLPLEMSLGATFPPPDTSVGTIHGWVFDAIAPGDHSFNLTVNLDPGLQDGVVVSANIQLEYVEQLGNSEPPQSLLRLTIVRAPIITAAVMVDSTTADVSEVLRYSIYVNNTGGGAAPRVWVNLTLNPNLEYVNSTGTLFAPLVRWELSDFGGGQRSVLHLNTSVKETAIHLAEIVNVIAVQSVDVGSFPRQASPASPTTTVIRRPNLQLNLDADRLTAEPGEPVILTVAYNNEGSGVAGNAWVNVTLPPGLSFERSNLGDPAYATDGALSWSIGSVSPGPHFLTITTRVNGSVADGDALGVNVTLRYEDTAEGTVVSRWTGELLLEAVVPPTIWDRIFWPWSLVLVVALVVGIYLIMRVVLAPPPPRVEELYLGYRDGRLLAHVARARRMKGAIDEDILSSMLQAIQTFVQDSFTEGQGGVIRRMEFGDSKLFVERGEYLYVAVIHGGVANRKFEESVGGIIGTIEDESGDVLRDWDGSMESLETVDDVLDGFMATWGAEPEDAGVPETEEEGDVLPEVEERRWERIAERISEEQAPMEAAMGQYRCAICKGVLREDLAQESCTECGSRYHQPCAVRMGTCPRCGAGVA